MESGSIVVISGASGIVGSAAAKAFLKHGYTALLLFRSAEKRDHTLANEFTEEEKKNIIGVVATFESDADVEPLQRKLYDAAKSVGKELVHGVSCIGSMAFSQGGITTYSVAKLEEQLRDSLFAHFVLAKATIPLIRNHPKASYTLVTGGAGEICFVPTVSPTTIKNAAQYGLALSLFSETEKEPIRVNELRIQMQLAKTDGNGKTNVNHISPIFVSLARGTQKGKVVKFKSVEEAMAQF